MREKRLFDQLDNQERKALKKLCSLTDPDIKSKLGNFPEIISIKKIWDKAPHNAFTDLIRFQGKWFCTFRESDKHVYGRDGQIRVLVSADGDNWESAALLTEEG
ncbi:MAG: hypothetical protein ACYTF1_18345, partial [Planctomycetota bacterium]